MKHLSVLRANTDSTIRRESLDGIEYLVAPVVAVREGVLNGELLLAEEIGAYVDAWNGIPLPIGHPMDRGMPISANTPELIASDSVGRFFRASFDGNALRGEIWVDINKCRELGGRALTALERLERGEPLEVSTAYFNDTEPGDGSFNGVSYNGIQRNLRPDHLALLPDEIGACSWRDGCGAPRINSREGGEKKTMSLFAKMKEFATNLFRVEGSELTGNEADFRTIQNGLETAMTAATGDAMRFLIRRVYSDYFIYQESTANGFDGRLWRRNYTVDVEGKITLGDQTEVRHVETYEPVTSNASTTEQPQTNHNQGDDGVSKKEIINGLIANGRTQFADIDRVWLETLTEDQLSRLSPAANSQEEQKPPAPTPSANSKPCGCGSTAPAANAGAATDMPPASNQTMEQFIAAIPDGDLRDFITNSQRNQKSRREKLVSDLSANSRCAFDKSELEQMSTNALEKLERSLAVDDYSGRGAPNINSYYGGNDDEIPAPPAVLLAKNDKEAN
ncbi:DUF2213 domain-containing protein [Paenibacillus mesophilus]|uniref:DUF2213 domain-containing protein n=1 Tax=Paenibacillus mesophilus TaxID=2582849 RepID=UPI00110DF287|nr:DUF2213 domain-containing protein [Paenibacillus mesophilus]TMV49371.1 DUF2213 domain-containing protein [Paenibacillus mesophilus]